MAALEKRNSYQRFVFPFLRHIDPETAHERTLAALALAQRRRLGRALLRALAGTIPFGEPVVFAGLRFPNRLGVAAGFDKDARVVPGLVLLGFGHVEVGTITPGPQSGNPKPRLFRLEDDLALINRLGFPSVGAAEVAPRLKAYSAGERAFVLGVSLGKQKDTPLDEAVEDYRAVMRAVYADADYLAVNISSPNTPELRNLQSRSYLDDLLAELAAENRLLAAQHRLRERPLLVKIAPDLTNAALNEVLALALQHKIGGIIATNTTVMREGLSDPRRFETGGLSGRPLEALSTALIRHIVEETGGRLPVIGVGGIGSAADARAKLDAGATLLQLYTALVYEGPGLAGRLLRALG